MGNHRRPSLPARHRKPGIPKRAAALTATAATATAAAGAIIAASHSAPAPAVYLPMAQTAANVTAEAPRLHVVPVRPPALTTWVKVREGDTLSGIAQRDCGREGDWTGIYKRNQKAIGPDYNLIQPRRELALDCRAVALPGRAVTAAYVAPPGPRDNAQAVRPASSGFAVTSGFQACVVQRESGGNAQVWNASGHYGLYQFSFSTWVAHGGAPSLFGRASAAYQTQVFWNTVRQDGTRDWAPYDGCL